MYADIFFKLVVGLGALLIVVRLLGKKELAQLTPFDVVYTLVLGGILEESIFDTKIKIPHFLFAIALWAILIFLIEKSTQKWNSIRTLLKGKPVVLIQNGQLKMDAFDKLHLEMEQLRTALRKQGIFSLREVRDIIVEPGGEFSINKYVQYDPVTQQHLEEGAKDEEPSILFIDQGDVKDDALFFAGKDREWLHDQLERGNYPSPEKIVYCEWSGTNGLFVKVK